MLDLGASYTLTERDSRRFSMLKTLRLVNAYSVAFILKVHKALILEKKNVTMC